MVARIARDPVERIPPLTDDINALEAELDERTTSVAPRLRQVPGVAASAPPSSSAKWQESPGPLASHLCSVQRNSNDTGLSGNTERHRLSRAGNRRHKCRDSLNRLTQARFGPDARSYLDRR